MFETQNLITIYISGVIYYDVVHLTNKNLIKLHLRYYQLVCFGYICSSNVYFQKSQYMEYKLLHLP
jgi:Na+/citrate or Na+/malate symporter